MDPVDPTAERERILAFERDLLARTTARTERFAFGTAYLDERFPLRYDSNLLWAEGPLEGVTAAELAAECDRVLGGLGLEHRNLVVEDPRAGERLAPGLLELGYDRDRLVTMVHRRRPDRPGAWPVRELDVEAYLPVVREMLRREPFATSEEVVRQLVEHRRVLAATGARFFVAFAGEVAASRCELYVGPGIAQIEDVGTLPEHRGRGLARAVVLRALDAARAAGAELVFLHADDEDWPKELYRRLGFDELARWCAFDRHPPWPER